MVALEDLAHGEEVAERLRHLLLLDLHEAVVHPHPGEGLAGCALGLGDLVLVVGELEVLSAPVDVEGIAQAMGGHGRTLDVPAGTSGSPGRCKRRLSRFGLLPEHGDEVIPEGAYITVLNAQPDGHGKTSHCGFVTSSYYSPALGHAFALALVLYWQATPVAYFIPFAAVSALEFALNRLRLQRERRQPIPPAAPAADAEDWRGLAGFATVAALAMAITQIDRIVLAQRLSADDYAVYFLIGSVLLALLHLQGRQFDALIKDAAVPPPVYAELMKVLRDCHDQQARCDRIKNTPYPRQYGIVTTMFVFIFCTLLPFGTVPMFAFCGTYFPRDRLPEGIRSIADLLPLSPLVDLLRFPYGLSPNWPWQIFILLAWTTVFILLAFEE